MNNITKKYYIGSAIHLTSRFNTHKSSLKKNKHYNQYLQNAWNKYGEKNFRFEVLEEVLDKNLLIQREQYYIDVLEPQYNICKSAGNVLGTKHTEEEKMKISKAHKGKVVSEETKAKLSKAHKENYASGRVIHPFLGRHHTQETKDKIRKANVGRIIPKEQINKMREYWKMHDNYWKGKNLTEEMKRKISENHADVSGENNPMYGKSFSRKHREKISKANSGENSGKCKLNWIKVDEIRDKYQTGNYTNKQLGEEYNLDKSTISRITAGRNWKEENRPK